jgi:hypothetical protein
MAVAGWASAGLVSQLAAMAADFASKLRRSMFIGTTCRISSSMACEYDARSVQGPPDLREPLKLTCQESGVSFIFAPWIRRQRAHIQFATRASRLSVSSGDGGALVLGCRRHGQMFVRRHFLWRMCITFTTLVRDSRCSVGSAPLMWHEVWRCGSRMT